jgi:hypothetical protein
MKLYQFNPENGVYAGELYEAKELAGYCEGVTVVAPPAYVAGEVPVYDVTTGTWRILSAAEVRRMIADRAGAIQGSYGMIITKNTQ